MKNVNEHGTPEISLRVEALESLLEEKGLINAVAVDRVIQYFEQDVGPLNGAKAVAHAWTNPEFKARLLKDAAGAISELGITVGDNVEVIENTPKEHNVVVCSLCSCYPWSVLGLPPTWYKSPAYRARLVREPRKLLAEMGLDLPEDVTIRVWDSSAEIRYMILPLRPDGADSLSEEELVPLITRDAMIGVADVTLPNKS
jgi:nitrile hydratase